MMSEAVAYIDGQVVLSPKERGFWVGMFGDVRLLELALVMAASVVSTSPNCISPYSQRVRSFLAKTAYGTIERAARFTRPSGPIGAGPRDTSESFSAYQRRMVREGKLPGSRSNGAQH